MMQNPSLLINNELEQLYNEKEHDSSSNTFCQGLSSGIINSQWTILDIVESLKDFLTSTELNRHNYGLHILANVIESLQPEFLLEKEIEFIAGFFCGQIKQHHSFVTASLKGLAAVVKNPHLSRNSLHDVTSTLFNNIVWQTQSLNDRTIFYLILQYIVFNRLEDYNTTSSELLFNIISSVDGERDPRNLLLLFSFLPKLYTSVPLGSLIEDAFEVVSCYFPIDFHSQTSDPGSVTREDLVSALYPCLLAHPDFAPLCLSLIQEKLESSLKSAKVDSYNLLVEAAEVWPGHVIAPHLGALWQTVRADLLPPRDLQTAEVALKALQAIIRTSNEPYLSPVLTSVMSCCEVFLSDVQMSMFEPSFRLLLSIMQSNTIACLSLSKKLLPKLISLLKVTDKNMCDVILDKITSFVEVCLQMNPTFEFSPDTWKEVVACTDTSMQAYYTLVPGVAQIDFDCRLRLYQNIMLHLTSSPTLGSACIKCLQAMAMIHADEVEEHVLKKISFDDKGKNVNQAKKEFEIVCSLAVVNTFHSTLDQLFNNFVTHGEPYLSLAISCLRNLLEIYIEKNNKKLFKFLFSHSCVISKLINLQVEEENLLNSAAVVRTLVASQEPSDQARCVPSYTKVVLQHKKQLNRVVFLEALLGPLWPQVTILTPEEIMTYIVPVAMNCFESELSRTYALQLLASIINKSADKYHIHFGRFPLHLKDIGNNLSDLQIYSDVILDRVSQIIASYEAEKESTVCACSYITKALVIRNHPVMRLWIDKLLDLLNSEVEEVAQAAAEGFLLILQDSDTSESHCVVRLLYRQHLFYLVLPRIVHSQAKLQHLKALAYLLEVVPHTVYMTHIKEILPLLVKSLDLDSESLLLTVLTTLSHLLSASDCFLQNHVDTFIPRFIHLARSSLFMHVRIASLKCLGSCLKFPPMLLLPHKQKVIADLMNCLDDKKRLVRKEAARTRSKWYLLGAPVPD